MWENACNRSRSALHYSRLYESKRPQGGKCDRMWLSINQNQNAQSWFKDAPLGKNSLAKFMKQITDHAGLVGKYSNHSLRRTMCTNLLHAGVAPNTIAQLSGHKRVESVNHYAVASDQQQKTMSMMLQNPSMAQTRAIPPANFASGPSMAQTRAIPPANFASGPAAKFAGGMARV